MVVSLFFSLWLSITICAIFLLKHRNQLTLEIASLCFGVWVAPTMPAISSAVAWLIYSYKSLERASLIAHVYTVRPGSVDNFWKWKLLLSVSLKRYILRSWWCEVKLKMIAFLGFMSNDGNHWDVTREGRAKTSPHFCGAAIPFRGPIWSGAGIGGGEGAGVWATTSDLKRNVFDLSGV